jgi:hypothetical protein
MLEKRSLKCNNDHFDVVFQFLSFHFCPGKIRRKSCEKIGFLTSINLASYMNFNFFSTMRVELNLAAKKEIVKLLF